MELKAAMRAMGYRPTHKDIRVMIGDADDDVSGTIGYEEFLRLFDLYEWGKATHSLTKVTPISINSNNSSLSRMKSINCSSICLTS